MNRYKILSGIALTTSIVLLVLPRIVSICTGLGNSGQAMQCHYAYQAEFLITLLAVILSASLLVLKTAEARLLTGFIIFLLGITTVIIPQPWAIGICNHAAACHKTTYFVSIGGGILALAGGLIGFLGYQQLRQEGKNDLSHLEKSITP